MAIHASKKKISEPAVSGMPTIENRHFQSYRVGGLLNTEYKLLFSKSISNNKKH